MMKMKMYSSHQLACWPMTAFTPIPYPDANKKALSRSGEGFCNPNVF
jgi:hypothetical protein